MAENPHRTITDPASILEQTSDTVYTSYLADLGLKEDRLIGQRILDLGAGAGNFAEEAAKKGISVISLDSLELQPKKTEDHLRTDQNPNKQFVIANMGELPFQDGAFDLVVARASMHDMSLGRADLENRINEAYRILKPGGEFRFTPSPIFPWLTYSKYQRALELELEQQDRPLTKNELKEYEQVKSSLDEHMKRDPEENNKIAAWFAIERQKSGINITPDEQRLIESYSTDEIAQTLETTSMNFLHTINPDIEIHQGTNPRRTKFNNKYFVLRKLV